MYIISSSAQFLALKYASNAKYDFNSFGSVYGKMVVLDIERLEDSWQSTLCWIRENMKGWFDGMNAIREAWTSLA